MDNMIELLSGILIGLALAALGAVTGFSAPTEDEAAADPATLRWSRRPAIRRRFGLLMIAMGALVAVLRIVLVTMR
jgi:hypothetical protein